MKQVAAASMLTGLGLLIMLCGMVIVTIALGGYGMPREQVVLKKHDPTCDTEYCTFCGCAIDVATDRYYSAGSEGAGIRVFMCDDCKDNVTEFLEVVGITYDVG